jgi:hypothetical protein
MARLRSRSIHRWQPLVAASLTAALVACGGAPERQSAASDEPPPPDPATACLAATPTPVALAVTDFIGAAEPKPERFLTAATTDSALPQAAEAVVSRKGPLFFWLPDPAMQAQMRAKLEGDGPWTNMLVVVREQADRGDGTWTVRVGGRYVGGTLHGTESPEKAYTVSCIIGDPSAWKVTDATLAGGA